MRTRLTLIAITLFMGVLVSGCNDDTPPPKTDDELQLEKLTGTWVLDPGANSVTVAGNDVSQNWTGFSLTIGGTVDSGTYQTSGSDSPEVWPSSGSWVFGSNVNIVVRDGSLEISNSIGGDGSLLLQFDYTTSGGRLSGIEGTWIFKMVPQ